MKHSKKNRLIRKKSSKGGFPKKNEFNIRLNYRGPLITESLWRQFSTELRMGLGFSSLPAYIEDLLKDPYLTDCRCKSTALLKTMFDPLLQLTSLENSIMISCEREIPHYYLFKPHVIKLIRAFVLRGEYDRIEQQLVPLEVGINLFIQNGDTLEHDVIQI
jgi:hypothetical protein